MLEASDLIKQQIQNSSVILYMKGTPEQPMCGFSATVVDRLKKCNVKFDSVNVLEYPEIRQMLPKISNWPTFPQLFVKGELIGGCDIVTEMFDNGELKSLFSSTYSTDT